MADLTMGVVGWNGRRNTGDDAMATVIVEHAARDFGGDTRCLLLADRAALPDFGSVGGRDAARGYRGYNLVHHVPSGRFRNGVWRVLYDRRFAREPDLLVFGGGSIFHGRGTLERYGALADRVRARNPRARVGAVGVSIGPFGTPADRGACAELVARLDFIAVRDRSSLEVLREMDFRGPVASGLDLAVLLPCGGRLQREGPDSGGDRIGVALRGDVPTAETEGVLAGVLARLLDDRRNVELELFVFCGDARVGDHGASEALARAIGRPDRVRIRPYDRRPGAVCEALARCRLMLAMRLHAGVLAYATETPFMMLAYHPKSAAFADEVGLPEALRLDARRLRPGALREVLEAELSSPRRPRARLPLKEGLWSARRALALMTEAAGRLGSGRPSGAAAGSR